MNAHVDNVSAALESIKHRLSDKDHREITSSMAVNEWGLVDFPQARASIAQDELDALGT